MADIFDCEAFAEYAVSEAAKHFAEDLTEDDKKFILEHFYDFALRSAKVLSEDKSLELNQEKIERIEYIILEWIFKVSIALLKSDIPNEFRHGIMLDIGYTAFDITKTVCNIPDITDNQIFNTGAYHVINKLKSILQSLISEGAITEEMRDNMLNHPYISESEKRIEFALNTDKR